MQSTGSVPVHRGVLGQPHRAPGELSNEILVQEWKDLPTCSLGQQWRSSCPGSGPSLQAMFSLT